ncbi:MAG: cation:proton antiporter [Candidatus Thermoplasmatota archaeon]|jgi:Kef-type K+ transport system membrane component KefB|nr:cation:proton antiporter [Candidatus Thermoplasmatota archaeon]MCL5789266.1 cation:proton antiporter [Candidatus Thermoplasmatota archaeon]
MLDLITAILLLLIVAIGLGEIFNRFSLPEVVGAIIAGIILGPAVTGIISPSSELSTLSTLALFFIILQIGVESSADIFTKNVKYVTIFALTSFIVPLAVMSLGSVFIFGIPYLEAVSTSLSVSVPSISIASVLLVRSGLIKMDDGLRLLGGIAMSDTIAFIVLVSFHRALLSIAIDTASLAAFVVCLYFLDMLLKSKSEILIRRLDVFTRREKEGVIFAVVILMGLAASVLFEYIGITFVLGAFFSGLIIHQNTIGEHAFGILRRTFQRINSSFFIPLFFSISGLEISVVPISYFPYIIFLIAATTSIGGLAAYVFSKRYIKKIPPAVSLGLFGGRGAVGIIIASLALSRGFIDNTDYSIAIFSTVIMAIAFTFVFQYFLKKGPLTST